MNYVNLVSVRKHGAGAKMCPDNEGPTMALHLKWKYIELCRVILAVEHILTRLFARQQKDRQNRICNIIYNTYMSCSVEVVH